MSQLCRENTDGSHAITIDLINATLLTGNASVATATAARCVHNLAKYSWFT